MYTVQELINELQKVKDKNKEVRLEVWDGSTNEFFDCKVCNVSEGEENGTVYLHADLFD